MARRFSMISCTLAGSRKLRSVPDHRAKFLYVMALTSPLGSFCGLFRYPLAVAADDASIDASEAKEALSELERTQLIEFDPDDQAVRIVGWFKTNAPTNADHALRLARDFGEIDVGTSAMRSGAFAEFLVAVCSKVPSWKNEKVEALMRELRPLVCRFAELHGEELFSALADNLGQTQAFVVKELDFLIPSFARWRDLKASIALCPHPADTVSTHETETITNTKTDTDIFPPARPQIESEQQDHIVSKPRNWEGPRDSTLNSPLALKAIGTSGVL